MASETGPKNLDPNSTTTSASAQVAGRPDKPLGRGLEDVSHLFLSQMLSRTAEEAVVREPTRRRPPVQGPSQPGAPAFRVLLRPHRDFAKDQLAAALRDFEGSLEEGLKVIDTNVPCDPVGDIDLIAIDRANQLAIIDVDTTPNDGLLLRGMGHFDWVVRNVANLWRMYPGQAIDFSLQPRLFLVAPQFSALLKSAARQIPRPRIDWVRYHVVDVFDGIGILFEHVEGQ